MKIISKSFLILSSTLLIGLINSDIALSENALFKGISQDLISQSNLITGKAIPVNFGNTLFYDRRSGCTLVTSNGSVIQRVPDCRSTWHSIVYTANKLIFYERSGDLEIYSVNQHGIGNMLQRYTRTQHGIRNTWAKIISPHNNVIVFIDDSGETENYHLTDSGVLERI